MYIETMTITVKRKYPVKPVPHTQESAQEFKGLLQEMFGEQDITLYYTVEEVDTVPQ